VEKTDNKDLRVALAWSIAVNDMIEDMVHDVAPFPFVRQSLEKLSPVAEMIVCSATPNAALQKEWEEHDISQFVQAICGQEAGSKKETLGQAKNFGYEENKVLMIGDAPGDMKAAKAVGALFFPINPGREEQSWERFYNEACDKFLKGDYAGDYEKQLIAEFDEYLPELPPWKR
jgi:phosphoglycolate phosphatase-like HAD superfamily hydrolase